MSEAVAVSKTLSIIFRNLHARPSVDTASQVEREHVLGILTSFLRSIKL